MKSAKAPAPIPHSSRSRIAHFLEVLAPSSSAEGARLRVSIPSAIAFNGFWLVVTLLLAVVLYAPMLNDWFQSDDFFFLKAARSIGALSYIREAFDFTGYDRYSEHIDFVRDDDIALPFLAYRPLTFVSFEGMYLVFGLNAVGYHVVSLLVHLANTLLVWVIARRLLKGKLGPHIAAIIFALHPAYVAAVAWVSDIGSLLATLTVLLSLLFFMRSMDSKRLHRGWYAGAIICYGASVFFHQQTLSWVVAFVALFVLVDPGHHGRASNPQSWSILSPFVGTAAGSFALQSWIAAHTPAHQGLFRVGPNMLTHFKNFTSGGLFPVTSDIAPAHFAAFILLLLILASLPVMAYRLRANAARPHAELFVIVWFLSSLAPLLTADAFFVVGTLNRKLYVLGPSLSILLVLFGASLLNLSPRQLLPQIRAVATLLLVLALVAGMIRATEYRRDVTAFAVQSETFVQALRETYPSLPEGSTLYVVGAPYIIRIFGDVHLVSAVKAFYGEVDAHLVTENEARVLEQSLDEGDHVFRYGESPP